MNENSIKSSNSHSIFTHFISFLPHSHQYSLFIIYHAIVIPFFPNSSRILIPLFSIPNPFLIQFYPTLLNSSLSHSFSLRSYPILSHFIIIFFPNSFLSHSFILRMCTGNALLGEYFPVQMRLEFSRCKRIHSKKQKNNWVGHMLYFESAILI